jgi:hypothetical protein
LVFVKIVWRDISSLTDFALSVPPIARPATLNLPLNAQVAMLGTFWKRENVFYVDQPARNARPVLMKVYVKNVWMNISWNMANVQDAIKVAKAVPPIWLHLV